MRMTLGARTYYCDEPTTAEQSSSCGKSLYYESKAAKTGEASTVTRVEYEELSFRREGGAAHEIPQISNSQRAYLQQDNLFRIVPGDAPKMD